MKATPRDGGRGALALLLAVVAGCADDAPAPLEGRPADAYRATLTLVPPAPIVGAPTRLTWEFRHAASGAALTDLAVAHERVVHNFIVARDFSSFAHVHHEDQQALTAADLAAARFHLDYRFPREGSYRVVSEFVHGGRGHGKHFDVVVGNAAAMGAPRRDFATHQVVGPYHATLHRSPAVPVAGFESELVLELARDGAPVTDLALHLGSELHAAIWREDGRGFGHTHSYTPHMAGMLAFMHDRAVDAATRAARMAGLMAAMVDMPAELVFPGPRVPLRYVFAEPGVYHLFLQCAPAGRPVVFHFQVEVVAHRPGIDTVVESMVAPVHHGH